MPKPIAALAAACLLAAAAGVQAQTPPVPAPPAPPTKTVRLLATGGTIAGAGQGPGASYRAGVVPIGDILRAVPGLGDVANVTAEQIANVGSYDVDEAIWRKLLDRIQGLLEKNQRFEMRFRGTFFFFFSCSSSCAAVLTAILAQTSSAPTRACSRRRRRWSRRSPP